MKNTLDGVNIRLDIAEEKIGELKDRNRNYPKRTHRDKRQNINK